MTSISTPVLPPLPKKAVIDRHLPTGIAIYGFTAEQMRDYALAVVELYKQSEDVAALRRTGYIAPKNRYVVPVLFNPYTGAPRDARDIASDPQGILIVPPGAALAALAAAPALTVDQIDDLAQLAIIDAIDADAGYFRTSPKNLHEFARAVEQAALAAQGEQG